MHKNNVMLLSTLENLIFLSVWAHPALIRRRYKANRSENFIFDQTSKLRLEISLISSNYT